MNAPLVRVSLVKITALRVSVNKNKTKDVGEMRQTIVEEWEQLDQHVIDNAIRQWRRRLRGCVDADGGQFEHSL